MDKLSFLKCCANCNGC